MRKKIKFIIGQRAWFFKKNYVNSFRIGQGTITEVEVAQYKSGTTEIKYRLDIDTRAINASDWFDEKDLSKTNTHFFKK